MPTKILEDLGFSKQFSQGAEPECLDREAKDPPTGRGEEPRRGIESAEEAIIIRTKRPPPAAQVLSGMGDPRVAQNLSGHGFGRKIIPVTGCEFFNGQIF